MKKALFIVLPLVLSCFVMDRCTYIAQAYDPISEVIEKENKEMPETWCPKTLFTDNAKCMDCHAMRIDRDGKPYFGLKELKIDANYNAKPYSIEIIKNNNEIVPYIKVDGTNSDKFQDAANYIMWHPEFKKTIVEIHSPGGSVMDAWRSVGIIREMQHNNILVETRCYGLSASAAVLLLAAGDIGHRFVNPFAEIMMHKVWTFKMFDIQTPDSSEDQTETLKHFQNNLNNFIVSRSNLTLEKIEELIFKKDFWFTGKRAVEFGLADGFIGMELTNQFLGIQ